MMLENMNQISQSIICETWDYLGLGSMVSLLAVVKFVGVFTWPPLLVVFLLVL